MNDETSEFEVLANAPLAIPKRATVEESAAEIGCWWQKAVPAIMACADACLQATRQFTGSELQKLIGLLPFNKASFSKLTSIGADPRLHEHADRLPPNWTILYDLRCLSSPMFDKALADGVISPSLQRAKLKKWVAAHGVTSTRATTPTLATLPLDFLAGVRVPSGYPEARQSELLSALNEIGLLP